MDDVVFNVLRWSGFESDPVSFVAVPDAAKDDEDGDSKLEPPSLETFEVERKISLGGGERSGSP